MAANHFAADCQTPSERAKKGQDMFGNSYFLAKLRIKNKMILMIAAATILAGCLPGRRTPTPAFATTQTVSINESTAEGQTPTAELVVPTTESSINLPDGNAELKIVFAEFRQDNKGIYITSPFNQWVSQQVISNQRGRAFYHSPSLSPDGETIAFAYDDGTGFRIYTVHKTGINLQQLVLSDDILPYQRYPSWSPDGAYMAFTVFNELYLTRSNGSNIQLLMEMGGLSYSVWSPDGGQIAFLAKRQDDRPGLEIFVIDKDGKNLQAFSDAIAGESRISWSPDGKQIAFRSLDGCGDISTINLTTGAITKITKTPYMEKDPAWSPDGNYIAFASSSYTDCEKYVAESPYLPSKLSLIDLRSHTVFDSMLLDGLETSLYEPSWWPTVVLQPNRKYSVTKAGSNLNVRESPSTTANSLVKLQLGEILTVLEGPTDADGYQWWRIRTDTGIEGWCVDVPGWFMFKSADADQ